MRPVRYLTYFLSIRQTSFLPECKTWCLILEIINIICLTHVLRSRLIDGDAYIQCKVSLVVSGVMVEASHWATPLTPVEKDICV